MVHDEFGNIGNDLRDDYLTKTTEKMKAKKINVYGVEMNSFQEMKFAKYIDNKGISMNTLNKKERFNLADKWLKSNFNV